jgi:hypothetical protein
MHGVRVVPVPTLFSDGGGGMTHVWSLFLGDDEFHKCSQPWDTANWKVTEHEIS